MDFPPTSACYYCMQILKLENYIFVLIDYLLHCLALDRLISFHQYMLIHMHQTINNEYIHRLINIQFIQDNSISPLGSLL